MSTESVFNELLEALNYENETGAFADDLRPFIGFLISKAAQSIVAEVDISIAEFGITSRHYGIMLILSRESGLQQITIGEKLKIDRTTMVKLVDTLEEVGFVERHRDPNDRRAYALSLTPKGHEVLPEMSSLIIEKEKATLSALTQTEIQELFRILLKLVS